MHIHGVLFHDDQDSVYAFPPFVLVTLPAFYDWYINIAFFCFPVSDPKFCAMFCSTSTIPVWCCILYIVPGWPDSPSAEIKDLSERARRSHGSRVLGSNLGVSNSRSVGAGGECKQRPYLRWSASQPATFSWPFAGMRSSTLSSRGPLPAAALSRTSTSPSSTSPPRSERSLTTHTKQLCVSIFSYFVMND